MKILLFTTTLLVSMISSLLVSGQFLPTPELDSVDGVSGISPYQSTLSRLVQSTANLYRSPLSSFASGASPLHSASSYQSEEPSSDAIGGLGGGGGGGGGGPTQESAYYNQQQPLQRSPTHQQGYYGGNPNNGGYRNQHQPQAHNNQMGYNQMGQSNLYGGGSAPPMMGSTHNTRSNQANRDNDDRDDDEGGSYGPGNGVNLFDQANNGPANNNNNGYNGLHASANNNRNNNYDNDGADEDDDGPASGGQARGNNAGGLNQAASHQRGPNHQYGMGAGAGGYGGFADPNAGLGFDLSALSGYNPYGGGGQSGIQGDGDYGSGADNDDQSGGGGGGKRAKAASSPNYGMAYGQSEADAYNQGRNGQKQRGDADNYDDNENDDD